MDNVEQIKQFKELLDEGIITQEEFDKKKADLLGIETHSNDKEVIADEAMTKESEKTQENTETAIVPDLQNKTSEAVEVGGLSGSELAQSDDVKSEPAKNTDDIKGSSDSAGVFGIFKSMPKPAIIGIVALILIIIIAAGSGTGSGHGVKGKWHCTKVAYLGTELTATTEEQQSDYTITFKGSTFDMSIYGEKISGTYERASEDNLLGSGGTLPTGTEVEIYTLTAGNPLMAVYYVDSDRLVVFLGNSADENNYIMYERD